MKINNTLKHQFRRNCDFKELFKIMRISLFLLFAFSLHLVAADTKAQNAQVELRRNTVSIKQLINEIEKQTDYLVVYSNSEVNTSRRVNVSNKTDKVSSMLDEAFTGTDIDYDFENNYIVLSRNAHQAAVLIAEAVETAQQKHRITGTVVDVSGEPIIGANVIEKGTTNGTVTDYDGNFVLSVEDNAVLQVSYIGYLSQEINVAGRSTISISLQEDTQALDELIVVGYGVQKKVNLTGSVSSISNQQISDRPVTSISSAIQGIVPGLTVTAGEGRPGADGNTSMRVRGQGTLNNASPYILIDGIESGSMNQLDPNDIESISVLKDAASAAIYGSKAANGVILITTKRGKEGKARVSYSTTMGWQRPTGYVERMSSADAAYYYNKALEAGGKAPRFSPDEIEKFKDGSDPYRYPNTDWNKLAFSGSGFQQHHNINLSGGSKDSRYLASVGFLEQNGILKHSNRQQLNLRLNFDNKITDRVNMRVNMSYIKNDTKDPTNSYVGGGSDQILRQLNLVAPWIPYKNEDGTYGTVGDGNPIAWLDINQTLDRNNQNISSILALDFELLKDLVLTVQGAYVSNIQDRKEFIKDIQYNSSKYHGPNKLNEATYLWNRFTSDITLNYNKTFYKNSISSLLGYNVEDYNYKYTHAYREGFPNNDMSDLNAGTKASQTNEGYSRRLAMMSFFGRVNYDYDNRYLLEFNLRADASSRFSPDHRWGYFPSVSGAWRISEEQFMSDTRDWLSSLKLRASVGQLGNQEALDDYYPWLATYSIGTNYPFGDNVDTGITQTTQKLSTITWEKSNNWGVGLDVFINNNLDITIDYYNRETKGIIMDVPVPGSFGLNPYKDNIGSLRNSGFELAVTYNKKIREVDFTVAANTAINKNEILNLGGVEQMISSHTINKIGHAYKSFYGYEADGLFKSQEEVDAYVEQYGNPFGKAFKPGDIKYKDVNGDGKLS